MFELIAWKLWVIPAISFPAIPVIVERVEDVKSICWINRTKSTKFEGTIGCHIQADRILHGVMVDIVVIRTSVFTLFVWIYGDA